MLWAIIIMVITLIPGTTSANITSSLTDKTVHFGMFLVLCLLMSIGLSKQNRLSSVRYNAGKVSILVSIGYGLLIEIVQFLLPYRSFSMQDLLADSAGVLAGYGIFHIIYKYNKK